MKINLVAFFLLIVSCQPYKSGELVFINHCANCHMVDGSGLRSMIPHLAQSYKRTDITQLTCLIRLGQPSEDSTVLMLSMPAFPQLTSIEIANVLNYLEWKWPHKQEFVTPDIIEKALNSCNK